MAAKQSPASYHTASSTVSCAACLQVTDELARSGGVDLIAIDSVAALTPRAEIEDDIGTQMVGAQARLMSRALRKLAGNAARMGVTVLFVNQIRHKVRAMRVLGIYPNTAARRMSCVMPHAAYIVCHMPRVMRARAVDHMRHEVHAMCAAFGEGG